MRISLISHVFEPSLGGTEVVAGVLARGLTAAGQEVQVVTQTLGPEFTQEGIRVWRRPTIFESFKIVRWSDVVLQNNISLETLWLPLLMGRPVLVTFHTWMNRPDGRLGWRDQLKRWVARRLPHAYGVSAAIAAHVGPKAKVLPNPYRDALFPIQSRRESPSRDLVFLGRLVSDKGVDLAIDALAALAARGRRLTLSIVGDGPEEPALRALAKSRGVGGQVTFLGRLQGESLIAALRDHWGMVIPSRWAEPFGLVALEGLACGLVPVGSKAGGLPEAIGPCGLTFENNDLEGLVACLQRLIDEPVLRERLLVGAPEHLGRFRVKRVIDRYEIALRRAMGGGEEESGKRKV